MCRPFPAARTALQTTGSAGPMRNSWKRPCPRCSAGRAGRTCPRALCRRASTSSGTGSRSWATAASGTGSRPRLSRPGLRHGGPAPAAGHRPGPRAGGGVLPPRQQGQPGLPARHAPQRGLHPPRGRRALLRANPQEQVKKQGADLIGVRTLRLPKNPSAAFAEAPSSEPCSGGVHAAEGSAPNVSRNDAIYRVPKRVDVAGTHRGRTPSGSALCLHSERGLTCGTCRGRPSTWRSGRCCRPGRGRRRCSSRPRGSSVRR